MMPLIPTLQPHRTLLKKQPSRKARIPINSILLGSAIVFVAANLFFFWHVLSEDGNNKATTISKKTSTTESEFQCQFREYSPRRYYKLNDQSQPEFLTKDNYIYGEWPRLLTDNNKHHAATKLCVDQDEWHNNNDKSTLPFADGTNPSILNMKRIQQHQQQHHVDDPISKYVPPNTKWISTVCMTNSQCSWKDSPAEIRQYHLSQQDKPDTVRTVLLFQNEHFETLAQTTIVLQRDAQWGRKVKAQFDKKKNSQPTTLMPALDDARLFLHQGQMWVSYREGPGFGYEAQVLNPIHLTNDDQTLAATLKASETTSFCCGRNMALMENVSNPQQLLSLTWVDPITVISVDTSVKRQRRLQEEEPNSSTTLSLSRRLKEKVKKSHIHGTNAFMMLLPNQQEFLGIAHFHRPNDRRPNDYARFGHHYTHAFYTVNTEEPYRLTGLSPEFVLPSVHDVQDAEIIQFASGLELNGDQLVIAYGINDCEAVVVQVDLKTVRGLIRPVEKGKQVVDFMEPLKTQS